MIHKASAGTAPARYTQIEVLARLLAHLEQRFEVRVAPIHDERLDLRVEFPMDLVQRDYGFALASAVVLVLLELVYRGPRESDHRGHDRDDVSVPQIARPPDQIVLEIRQDIEQHHSTVLLHILEVVKVDWLVVSALRVVVPVELGRRE